MPISDSLLCSGSGDQVFSACPTPSLQHRSGSLLLVANNQTLVPLASTFSVTYVAAGSSMQDKSNVVAIVVPVVVGVVAIVAIVAVTIVILVSIQCIVCKSYLLHHHCHDNYSPHPPHHS